MKRFIVVTALFSISILVAWVTFQIFTAPASSSYGDTTVPVIVENRMVAPVFDNSGAVVSDPSGTILNADASENLAIPATSMDRKVAPVFDASGMVVSDPTGTLLGAIQSGVMIVPVTDPNARIAPVYDATGNVISDPTGTMLSDPN